MPANRRSRPAASQGLRKLSSVSAGLVSVRRLHLRTANLDSEPFQQTIPAQRARTTSRRERWLSATGTSAGVINVDTPGTLDFLCTGNGATTYDISNIKMRVHYLG